MDDHPMLINFLNDHFGMFVHWGLFSVAAGVWKGQAQEPRSLGEAIMLDFRIPLAEYRKLADAFRPDPDYARNLVRAARDIGARYIVITAKHCDGFCLFKTAVNDYNAYDMIGRDLIGELAEACREEGVKLGIYYNHTLDLSEPNALGTMSLSGNPSDLGNTWDFPNDIRKDFSRFLYGKVFPQVKELLTGYGDVLLMWFDYPHNITKEQSLELYRYVRSLQPQCLVNSRIGHHIGNYYDLGDNQIPTVPMGIPQECLVTLNDTWGYKRNDHHWKSAGEIIGMIARTASCGANLLMNVGPTSDGSLPEATIHILKDIARWTSVNGEAVYGIRCSPFKSTFDWGYVASRDNALYCYMKDNQARSIELNGLVSEVESITALDGGDPVHYEQKTGPAGMRSLVIRLPASAGIMPVYRIRCKSTIKADDRILQQGDLLELHPFWARKCRKGPDGDYGARMPAENNVFDRDNGRRGLAVDRSAAASGWFSQDEYILWEAVFAKPGKYEISMVTLPGPHIEDERCSVCVEADGPDGFCQTISTPKLRESYRYRLSETNKTNIRVVSPCGAIEIGEPGPYILRLYRTRNGGPALPVVSLRFTRS